MSDIHSARYPLHDKRETVDGVANVRTCAAVFVLPEQVGRAADAGHLFCLGCKVVVPATSDDCAAARRAAEAEGWRPAKVGPPTPGAISEDARRVLSTIARSEKDDKWVARGWADLSRAGLTDGPRSLNANGLALQALVRAPEVPAAAFRIPIKPNAHEAYAKAEKRRQKKAKATKPPEPALPMVCTCDHSASMHTAGPCRSLGCKCSRYVQQRPAKTAKPARKSKTAAA
jgi:hypothetical protein